MRLYGNINKTEPDAWDINHAQNGSYAAGREGVRNKDINALLSWKMTPQQILDFSYAYSRQGNIYAGDTQYSNGNLSPNGLVDSLYGHETNRLYRQSWGLTYNGLWDWGQSKAGVYYEKTNNTRLQEGSTGRVEGMINSEDYATSRLESWRTTSEFNVPFFWLADQTLTLGMEWNHDQLDDPASMQATNSNGETIPGTSGDPTQRSIKNSATLTGIYLEDNIEAVPGTNLIPAFASIIIISLAVTGAPASICPRSSAICSR